MPNVSVPSVTRRRVRLNFHPVDRVNPKDSDQRQFQPGDGLRSSLEELEEATRNCVQLVNECREVPRPETLFSAVVAICLKCRSSFAEWDAEEALNGCSIDRERLAKAMANCHRAVSEALPFLQTDEHENLTKKYLQHIDERIQLLEIMESEGRDTYEAKKEAFLSKALRRHSVE